MGMKNTLTFEDVQRMKATMDELDPGYLRVGNLKKFAAWIEPYIKLDDQSIQLSPMIHPHIYGMPVIEDRVLEPQTFVHHDKNGTIDFIGLIPHGIIIKNMKKLYSRR